MWVHEEKLGSPTPIDDLVMDQIGGAIMKFLIVSAMINRSAVSSNSAPLLIINMIEGMIGILFVFLIAPATLPNFQFK